MARNGPSNRRSNGDDNGEEQRQPILQMDEFVLFCASERSALKPQAIVLRAALDGRPGGARLGTVDLDPLETLDERLASAWPGSHTLRVQARTLGGQWAAIGEMALATAAPSTTPGADPTTVELLRQLRDMQAKLDARAAAPQPDPLAMMERAFGWMKQLAPTSSAAPTVMEQIEAVKEQHKLLRDMARESKGDTSSLKMELLSKAVDKLGEPIAQVLSAVAAGAAMKVAERQEAAEARAKHAEAQRVTATVQPPPEKAKRVKPSKTTEPSA